ncbi:MAG: heparinase II/III family protein [Kiloniellales bacterium]
MTRGASGFAERLRDLAHLPRELALARLGYDLKRPVFALPLYRYSLAGATATSLTIDPSDSWPGDAAIGAGIVEGVFAFSGRRIAHPAPLWAPIGAEPGWIGELHGFAWLRDLRAAGGDAARRAGRDLVGSWLDHNHVWSSRAWNPLTTGRRLANWLGCYEFFAASAAVEFRHRLLREIARQARHLFRVLPAGLAGAELIGALKGLIYAGVCLPGGAAWRSHGLAVLLRELPRQILPDGGHVERSPGRHLAVLRDLIDVRSVLHKGALRDGQTRGDQAIRAEPVKVPSDLQIAIEGMAPALRMLQHGDGGLGLFNGTVEVEGWQLDLVLRRAGGRRSPLNSAPDSGFQRLCAGRTTLLVDAGAPASPGLDRVAHAGTLSLEVSIGRERLIVNCGARLDDPAWRWAQRATAAHSTLVVEDTNSSQLLAGGGIGSRPQQIQIRREENEGDIWLDLSHDGYRRLFGLIHHRRIFLGADGNDVRGEDRLAPAPGRQRETAFALRFHLHPEVQANLSQGGNTVLLRLPKGGGWQLRAAGAEAGLEQSIYLGRDGEIRRSQQAVFRGRTGPKGAVVKWALKRLSRKGG